MRKFIFLFTLVIVLIGFCPKVNAGTLNTTEMDANVDSFQGAVGIGDVKSIAYSAQIIIAAFLSLLAIIFIILVIIAGYNWMTAAGDDQKVTKAKETIQKAIIGIIIIAMAYAITQFVFKSIPTGANTGQSNLPN